MDKVKHTINNCVRQNEELTTFVQEPVLDSQGVDDVIYRLIDLAQKTNYSVAIQGKLVSLLQLTNDPVIYEQYTLEDLRSLLQSQLNLQTYNLETYVEAGYFEWVIMDDSDRAKHIVAEGISQARHMLSELEQLQQKIEAE